MVEFPYKKVLVTGASGGIGAEFARQLAAMGADVVLVARRADRLDALAGELRALGREAVVFAADLENPLDRRRVGERMAEWGIDGLINNAGYGKVGRFVDCELEVVTGQIELNVQAVVELSHMALRHFLARRGGFLINVASVAGFGPMPFFTIYAATKSFVRDFSDCLREELRGEPIQIAALCPGPTDTEFFDKAGPSWKEATKFMSAEECVRIALADFLAGKTTIIPGTSNKVLAGLARFVPRVPGLRLVGAVTAWRMAKEGR